MKHFLLLLLLPVLSTGMKKLYAQAYTPIAVTGFNNDIVAEAGTNAANVTTTSVDLTNHILYSAAFATANGIAGGIYNTGTITSGVRTYQLNGYTGNNALYLSAGGRATNSAAAGTLSLTTPASYSKLSLLLFSTEGSSVISTTLNFTDGTTAPGGTVTVQDWYYGTNAVYAGFGRIVRKTAAPYTEDGVSGNNPRLYAFDITLGCDNKVKLLKSVTVNYQRGIGANGPRAVIMAVSGMAYTPLTVKDTVTAATCGMQNGKIALTVSGGTAPLSYLWNTTPAQTTATAVNLGAGNYSCIISDVNGCTANYQGTVTQLAGSVINVTASPDTICLGNSSTLSVTSTGGTISGISWQPGNLTGNTVSVTPSGTTRYIVTGKDNIGCNVTDSVMIVVDTSSTASFSVSNAILCGGDTITVTFTGKARPGAIPTWNWGGGTVQSGSGFGPFRILYNTSGTITLSVADGVCSTTALTQTVTVIPSPVADFNPDVKVGCAPIKVHFNNRSLNADAYLWKFGDGSTATTFSPDHSYTATGTYDVTLVAGAQQQCFDTLTIPGLINVLPSPVAEFTAVPGTNIPVEYAQALFSFRNYSQYADTYVWDFGDGDTSHAVSPQHRYLLPGNYRVILHAVNQAGCTDTVSYAWYMVVPDPNIRIPNAFSPNGDGINDRWEIPALRAYPDCRVEIYNRWGQIVFNSRGYTTPWNGTWNDRLLPVGTYYYVITGAGSFKPFTGWVTLLR